MQKSVYPVVVFVVEFVLAIDTILVQIPLETAA
jgi:hypothetical protein